MLALEFGSGVGLLVLAAAILSPHWLPPLRDEVRRVADDTRRSWDAFWASVPGRWAKAKARWYATKGKRRTAAILAFLCVLGGGWLLWVSRSAVAIDDTSLSFRLLFFGIGLGTILTGIGTAFYAAQIISLVLNGFPGPRRPLPPSLPLANPMNRVGTASPLGEARFATAEEVDSALAGRGGHFVPPKFRD